MSLPQGCLPLPDPRRSRRAGGTHIWEWGLRLEGNPWMGAEPAGCHLAHWAHTSECEHVAVHGGKWGCGGD